MNKLFQKPLFYISIPVCFLLSYILSVIINLGYLPLDGEEPRRAIVSIEMITSGNYILPTVFGWEYFNKPPVYNWFMGLLMNLFATTKEWVVRLPSLISIILWAVTNYFFVSKFLSKKVALLSSLFLLTCFDLYFYALANGGEIDVFYSYIVYLQVFSLFYFNEKNNKALLFTLSYFLCAIGFLTKGFPSFAFQGFTLLALCVYNKSIKILFSPYHLVGILVAVGLLSSYLFYYSFYNSPQTLVVNLLSESFKKSAVGEQSERLWSKVFLYPFSFFKLLLPWSLILLLLLKKSKYKLFQNPLLKFSFLFIVFNIGIYAFTGRPILRYVYMFIPFAYIILASIFEHYQKLQPLFIQKVFKFLGAIFILLLAGILLLPFFKKVQIAWIITIAVLLSLLLWAYFKYAAHRIWVFGAGIVIARLAYSTLFIPIKYNMSSLKYDKEVKKFIHAVEGKEIKYWSPPETYPINVDLKFVQWHYQSVPSPPFIYYQLPYYIHYHTGRVVKYDTAIHNNQVYLAYKKDVSNLNIDTLASFYDSRQKAEFILFQKK